MNFPGSSALLSLGHAFALVGCNSRRGSFVNISKLGILIVTLLTVSACGKGFRSNGADAPSVAGESLNDDTPVVPSSSPFTKEEASDVGIMSAQMLPEVFTQLSGIAAGSLATGLRTATINFTCPQGNVSVSASGSVSVSTNNTQLTGTLTSGSATVDFNGCEFEEGFKISGRLTLSNAVGNSSVNLNLSTGMHSLSATSSGVLSGTLQIVTDTGTHACTVNLNNNLTATGTLNQASATATGTIAASVNGTACGHAITQSLNIAL